MCRTKNDAILVDLVKTERQIKIIRILPSHALTLKGNLGK